MLERPDEFARTLFAFVGQRSPRLFLRWAWGRLEELGAQTLGARRAGQPPA